MERPMSTYCNCEGKLQHQYGCIYFTREGQDSIKEFLAFADKFIEFETQIANECDEGFDTD